MMRLDCYQYTIIDIAIIYIAHHNISSDKMMESLSSISCSSISLSKKIGSGIVYLKQKSVFY